ncbi:hypothetical protein Tco_0791820 [Tanacetum coccineum]
MRENQPSEFTNGGFNEFQKQTGNILNHVETFATFDALDNVSSGYGHGYDVPSIGTPLACCSSRITGLYLDDFRKCSEFCGVKLQLECTITFRVINRAQDAQLYLDVYQKYSRVSGKVLCSSFFIGGVGDGLDKRRLQPSGHSDVFEAYLALCSSGAGSRCSRSLSQITTIFNSNLVHTDFSSVCGPFVSVPGRSFHANPNAIRINGQSDSVIMFHEMVEIHVKIVNLALQQSINVQVRRRLISAAGVPSTSRRTRRRVVTSANTVDPTSVVSVVATFLLGTSKLHQIKAQVRASGRREGKARRKRTGTEKGKKVDKGKEEKRGGREKATSYTYKLLKFPNNPCLASYL